MNRKLEPLLLLLSIILSGLCLYSCKKPEQAPANFEEWRQKEPLSESYNAKYLYSENQKLKAKLFAKYVFEVYPTPQEQSLTVLENGVEIEFFDSLGNSDSKLTADRAKLWDKKDYAEAYGNVILINRNGDKLETEKLRWFKKANKITTNTFVKITTPKEILFGDSLDANANISLYKIYKLRGTVTMQE